MSQHGNLPFFNFLGYNIQKINYERIGDDEISELEISISSSSYDKDSNIYLLTLDIALNFKTSKNNIIRVLGAFKINEIGVLENENNIRSIFSATLYPFVRNLIYTISSDDRTPLMLPAVDLRHIDVSKKIIFTT